MARRLLAVCLILACLMTVYGKFYCTEPNCKNLHVVSSEPDTFETTTPTLIFDGAAVDSFSTSDLRRYASQKSTFDENNDMPVSTSKANVKRRKKRANQTELTNIEELTSTSGLESKINEKIFTSTPQANYHQNPGLTENHLPSMVNRLLQGLQVTGDSDPPSPSSSSTVLTTSTSTSNRFTYDRKVNDKFGGPSPIKMFLYPPPPAWLLFNITARSPSKKISSIYDYTSQTTEHQSNLVNHKFESPSQIKVYYYTIPPFSISFNTPTDSPMEEITTKYDYTSQATQYQSNLETKNSILDETAVTTPVPSVPHIVSTLTTSTLAQQSYVPTTELLASEDNQTKTATVSFIIQNATEQSLIDEKTVAKVVSDLPATEIVTDLLTSKYTTGSIQSNSHWRERTNNPYMTEELLTTEQLPTTGKLLDNENLSTTKQLPTPEQITTRKPLDNEKLSTTEQLPTLEQISTTEKLATIEHVSTKGQLLTTATKLESISPSYTNKVYKMVHWSEIDPKVRDYSAVTIRMQYLKETNEWFLEKETMFRRKLVEFLNLHMMQKTDKSLLISKEDVVYILPSPLKTEENNIVICFMVCDRNNVDGHSYLASLKLVKTIRKAIKNVKGNKDKFQLISVSTGFPKADQVSKELKHLHRVTRILTVFLCIAVFIIFVIVFRIIHKNWRKCCWKVAVSDSYDLNTKDDNNGSMSALADSWQGICTDMPTTSVTVPDPDTMHLNSGGCLFSGNNYQEECEVVSKSSPEKLECLSSTKSMNGLQLRVDVCDTQL